MPKKKNKTQPTKTSAAAYTKTLTLLEERKSAKILVELFKTTTKTKPVMWGNIFGFGSYHYKYESGREGDYIATGFAIRKSGPVIYIMPGYGDYSKHLKQLGPHKLGKSCLYLKSLDNIDLKVLQRIIKAGLKDLKKNYKVNL